LLLLTWRFQDGREGSESGGAHRARAGAAAHTLGGPHQKEKAGQVRASNKTANCFNTKAQRHEGTKNSFFDSGASHDPSQWLERFRALAIFLGTAATKTNFFFVVFVVFVFQRF
jgi:hypothetical protein